ncbi:hypothetical protein TIFTF001_020462 [Ficus carica]|uniref:Putative plant transposon protein domain-containing protein n=1 Tax=Ficus carica TaxID=3494 RepID=A0AA88AAU0_FICCA|nr:hypothetical protein TIFTF001_020462 [Ficus carica]
MPHTKKLAHKQSGRRPKDTTSSYRTFQSNEAVDRYDKFTSGRSFCPVKGFLLQNTPAMGYDEFIHSIIAKHHWQQFYAHPTNDVVPIVREFYAHFTGDEQRTVYVQGVQVLIDKDTVNQFYGLEETNDLHTEYAPNAIEEWLASALATVCVDGTVWTVSTQGTLKIPRISLTPQYGVQGSSIAAGFHYLGPPHRCG